MVRPRGLEPPQDCSYQPLKLARLPFRHDRIYGFFMAHHNEINGAGEENRTLTVSLEG